MAKDIVTKAEILGGEIDVRANFGQTVKVTVSPDPYMGDTEVTPSAETQVLATKKKFVQDDITVLPAPTEALLATLNGTFTPSSGKVGFSQVNVDVNPDLRPLSVSENGQYSPDGFDGYSQVSVDVPAQYKDGKNNFSGGNLLALITHGREYLTTNFFPPANTNYLLKFRVIRVFSNPAVFGTIYKPPGCEFRINIFAGSTGLQKSRYAVSIGISGGGVNIDHDTSIVTVIPINSPCPDSDDPSTYPLAIFGQYAGNSTGNVGNTDGYFEFYGLKCYDQNGNLVKKYVPWLDNDGVPCVHELVDDEYFYNVGTGTFGYIDLEGNTHNA